MPSPGIPFKDLPMLVKAQLRKDTLSELDPVSWHTTTVKLELEVRGEVGGSRSRGPSASSA